MKITCFEIVRVPTSYILCKSNYDPHNKNDNNNMSYVNILSHLVYLLKRIK